MTKRLYNSLIVAISLGIIIPFEINDYRFWLYGIIVIILNLILYNLCRDDK